LNICILVGSTRTEGPPRPILSNRVTQYVQSSIKSRQAKHTISILNAKEVSLMTKPHFAYAKSQLPNNLASMHTILQNSDAYITITPEYNHSPCPGLMNLMNHFGSSTFSFKPSGIVSYSSGQWGGTRAAHSLRPFLTELGCLPVSAMVNIPNAMNVLDEEGNVINVEEEERWGKYLDRMIYQVEFWANAAKNQRYLEDPTKGSPAFVTSPSERNAPN
jgi:chromate reductase